MNSCGLPILLILSVGKQVDCVNHLILNNLMIGSILSITELAISLEPKTEYFTKIS